MNKILVIIISVCLITAGCSSQNSNEDTLEFVLNQMLNCANESISATLKQSITTIGESADNDVEKDKQQEAQDEIDKYSDTTYRAFLAITNTRIF